MYAVSVLGGGVEQNVTVPTAAQPNPCTRCETQEAGEGCFVHLCAFSLPAVMHLYFARFFAHFLHDEGMLAQREPFVNLLTQGMVMGQSYRVKGTGRYLTPDQVDISGGSEMAKSATP